MALSLTNEQRSKVISLIKNHVAEHGNCRVGWAMREVAGEPFGEVNSPEGEDCGTQSRKRENTGRRRPLRSAMTGIFSLIPSMDNFSLASGLR